MYLLFGLLLATLLREAELQGAICNPACLSDEVCETVNNVTACYCNSSLYQNSTYDDVKPIVDCQSGKMVISIGKCLMMRLHNAAQNAYFMDDKCTGANISVLNNINTYSIESAASNSICGNTMLVNATDVTYMNVVHYPPSVSPAGLISGRLVNASFACSYKLNMLTSLATVLHPVQTTVNLNAGGNGTATTIMAAYSNPAYTSPIQTGGQDLPVGSSIYFGMSTQFADVNVFVLRVDSCFATPTENPNDPNKLYLIQNGCSVDGDVYTTVVSNGESLEVRFSVQSFAFQSTGAAYIYCNARLCYNASGICTGCQSSSRSDREILVSGQFTLGPFTFGDDGSSSGSVTAASWAVLGSSLMALLSLRLM